MEEKIKNVIEKIIMKKYPVITGVDNVRDVFDNLGKQHSFFRLEIRYRTLYLRVFEF